VPPSAHSVTFELPDASRRTIAASPDEPLLAAARRQGLALPSRCEQGWDLACAARVVEGELDHRRARRYYAEDAAAGYALICVATPCSDVVLETHQSVAMRRHREVHGLPTPRAVAPLGG
jgi:ferredoxin